MKLGAEYKQMPAFAARGGQNQIELWARAQNLKRRDRERLRPVSPAVMRIEVDGCPTALSTRVPRVKSDCDFVLRCTRDGVPTPGDSFCDIRRLRFDKSWRAVGVTV